jgi:hypothetical protein
MVYGCCGVVEEAECWLPGTADAVIGDKRGAGRMEQGAFHHEVTRRSHHMTLPIPQIPCYSFSMLPHSQKALLMRASLELVCDTLPA